ncbi:uncharacterized protein LOC111194087 [Astyanax mexicanus]|uniref:uncharacterized protein LOC111194087 n=1 Tax=Astyanax mexicanus TaxID=7994 RepID=UPI0020CAF453|nr:uncharacterized protein LOC111194087 [Astyanax mexicanus]
MPQTFKRMEGKTGVPLPQLSNEMQLDIMHKVKNGELSIDDALDLARRDRQQLLQKSFDTEEKQALQYNFSVHKLGGYRWQKRVLQIDFNTKMMCSIERGIVKRQFPFTEVKNCHDASGSKFTVSFKGHHDYELEAMSPQDKQKIMELIHQIIYRNIHPVDTLEEPSKPPASPTQLHEGQLLLQRGGLASCKWKMYDAHLYTGQLTLLPVGYRPASNDTDVPFTPSQPLVIHLSDGNASVETLRSSDTFILLTNQNEFHFRVPMGEQMNTEDTRSERDTWVKAIDKQCVDWKRKSQYENIHKEDLHSGHMVPVMLPQNLFKPLPAPVPFPFPEAALALKPSPDFKPQPRPRKKTQVFSSESRSEPAPQLKQSQSPTSPPALVPPPPLPPPLPMKKKKSQLMRTKAFHWDLLSKEKIVKSVWARGSPREIEIDTKRLCEQFGVKDSGHFSNSESSNHVEIMLSVKIAHNFNIFLKSFPVQPKELKDKLFIVNEGDGGLSDEHITSLRRYVPTADDIEMYKSYKGDVNELHIVDQYMMELCNIPYLSTQLDLLLTLRELPISMDDLKPLISQKIHMCQQLWGCEAFVCVLEYLLTIGNYLNQHAGKEKAKGFRLSSLTKLMQLRGNERKFTLMHALVEQIMLHEPRLATFFRELAEFETVPGASIKGLTAEVDVLKNELQKVIQYRKTYKGKNLGSQHTKFTKDLKASIEKYEADLNHLTKRCDEMRKLYTDILVKFGEPLNQDSQEVFGWVCQFINEFKRTHSELTR